MLAELGFEPLGGEVADLGCGYGTFSIAAARLTASTVHALDIDPLMVETTARRARSLKLDNLRAVLCDVLALGTGLSDESMAFVMLFNMLHAEQPQELLREARRILRPGGRLGIIHWIHDAQTPRGPALAIRPRPEQCRQWAEEAGLVPEQAPVPLPPHHYGVVVRKPR